MSVTPLRTRSHRWAMLALAALLLTGWVLSVSRAGVRVEGCGDCRPAPIPQPEGAPGGEARCALCR